MRIQVLGAGGMNGIGMTRSLKGFEVYGRDDSMYAVHLMEVPRGCENPDLIIPVPDVLVRQYAQHPKTFLPPLEDIVLCQDKAETAKALGDLAPKLHWIRDTVGAGGWGAQMCSEYLPGRNCSVELIFKNGNLESYFMKERVSYLSNRIEPSVIGIGNSAISTCIDDNHLFDTAMKGIQRISKKPHGIYSVDLKENEDGEPKITEINPGRFLTASCCFYYLTEWNLPKRFVELYFGLPVTPFGSYPEGLSIVRQRDKLPWIGRL